MIFASTPATGAAPRRPGWYLAAGVGWGRVHQPNPILVQIREDNERAKRWPNGVDLSGRVDMWLLSIANLETFGGFNAWESLGHPRHVLLTASSDEIDHARRVLERLHYAGLSAEIPT